MSEGVEGTCHRCFDPAQAKCNSSRLRKPSPPFCRAVLTERQVVLIARDIFFFCSAHETAVCGSSAASGTD